MVEAGSSREKKGRMRFMPRLTYSNVVATLAIFIALGGISYAATNLSKNSVGTKQIKKNAVTAKKIKKNAVTTAKIKKNAVNTAKIKNQAVATSKLADQAVTEDKMDPGLLASIDEEAKQKVLNNDGSVLGEYAGTYPLGGSLAIFQVVVDGGLYTYYGSGQLIPLSSGSPSFKNNTCTGTGYVETDQAIFDLIFSKLAGGPYANRLPVIYGPHDSRADLGMAVHNGERGRRQPEPVAARLGRKLRSRRAAVPTRACSQCWSLSPPRRTV